eukprot:SAG31_NODE_6852_length_1870_cov_1.294749_3_plen_89_part_01
MTAGRHCVFALLVTLQTTDKKIKIKLDASHDTHLGDEDFIEDYIKSKVTAFDKAEQRKKAERRRKRKNNFERRYRERVEQDAIRQAGDN